MEKTYKNIDELIAYLKNNKRIIVRDEHKHIFEERSYSSLINPYKEFFSYGRDKDGNHIYLKDVDFEEILKIIRIDEDFCSAMYAYIGAFEKKLKNVLFDEMCKKYLCGNDVDIKCISYVKEIDCYLNTNELPRFCLNLPYTLTKKGYIEDCYDLEKKKNLLIHIRELGSGMSLEGTPIEKSNNLIAHYLKTQSIAPLWVIPNALTLGELKMLFSMLDSSSQKKIVSKFYNIEEYEKISIAHILKFSGAIEIIRRIRNVVNHYEPIFPLLLSELKQTKKVKESQIYSVLNLLEKNYASSTINKEIRLALNLDVNNYNSKYIKVLDVMRDFVNG